MDCWLKRTLGLLSVPTAFYDAGTLGGFVYFGLFAVMTYYSTFLLVSKFGRFVNGWFLKVEACDTVKRYSYCGLVEACSGNRVVSLLMKLIYFVNNWGILTLYIIRVSNLWGL